LRVMHGRLPILGYRIGQLGKSRIMLVVETKLFFHNSSFFKG